MRLNRSATSTACLALALLLLALLPVPHARGGQHGKLSQEPSYHQEDLRLTDEEKRYVAEHPEVVMCTDPDWEPYERIDENGRHVGIAPDLIALVARHTGLRFRLLPTKTWEESLAHSKSGACDVLSFLNQSPERDKWLIFTEPLLKDPNVFITRTEHAFIAEPESLAGETIALPSGTYVSERLKKEYPNIRVIDTGSEAEALRYVADRKADMSMRSLIVAAYNIRKEGIFNLKISGQIPEYANRLRIGVRQNKPMLRNILDKGVKSITPQEREAIISRHVSITVEMGVDRVLAVKIALAAIVVIAFGMYWTLRLRHLNKQLKLMAQTDVLTGLLNRSALDSRLAGELERAQRYNRPFSLLMFDIDRFKATNDDFGHLMGDKVLIAITQAAKDHIRATDTLGRWGGEEFLVLCPETHKAEALVVAERIRAGVERAGYPTGKTHTVSIGISTAQPSDSTDSLIHRADTALYEAKNSGRNRVHAA